MLFTNAVSVAALCLSTAISALPNATPQNAIVRRTLTAPTVIRRSASSIQKRATNTTYYSGPVITPKVVIISLFGPEENIWHTAHYDLLAQNISIPGLSPVYPLMHCNADGSLCQVTTGESEINAASTISALVLSRYFDLTSTYFIVSGIAGVNPAVGTIGSVAIARYAVQVGLEYEIATSDNLTAALSSRAGYIPLGAKTPDAYPVNIYGTEVFELNVHLRNKVLGIAQMANLTDSTTARNYRAHYPKAPANKSPQVFKGDTETSDVYWHGAVLGDAFESYFQQVTNGSGKYAMTAQEDAAVLEVMIRGAQAGLVDFERMIVMRGASNFDRPYPGESAAQSLLFDSSGGFSIALANLYNAGKPIVDDMLTNWKKTWAKGIKPTGYAGDILDTVPNGFEPDIGTDFGSTG